MFAQVLKISQRSWRCEVISALLLMMTLLRCRQVNGTEYAKPLGKKKAASRRQQKVAVNLGCLFGSLHTVVFRHRQPRSCRGPFLCWEQSRTPNSSGRCCEFLVRTILHPIKSDNSYVSGYQATETAAG